MTSARVHLLSLICLASLASIARAESPAASIRDDANLFHADALARAEQRIADIQRTFDRHLFVRTIASASPPERSSTWWRHLRGFHSRHTVNHLLDEQVQNIVNESGRDGIYVVICKNPRGIRVVVRPGDDSLFTRHDAETLRKRLAHRFADEPDAALFSMIEQVHITLKRHATEGSPSVGVEIVLTSVFGGGVCLWILLGILRFKMRSSRPAIPRDEEGAMQAREGPALLGAMFGFPAGLWIYDKLYPCPSGTPLPLCEPEPEANGMAENKSMEGTHAEDAPVSP